MEGLRVQLRLILPGGKSFGPGKAELLALISRLGSISAAGRAMKISYKRAWGLVEEMNQSFQAPLVISERGGALHGGARVTPEGQAVLAHYLALVARVDQDGAAELAALEQALAPLPERSESDIPQ